MPRFHLRQIGESLIEIERTRVTPGAPHLFSLLLYLGIERGREVPRAEITELLFPDSREGEAFHNLRQLIYRARRLGAPLRTSSVSIALECDHVTDDLTQLLVSVPLDIERVAPGRLQILPHYSPPTEPLDHWLERHRDLVRPQLLRALARDLESFRSIGHWQSVERLAKAILEHDAFNETATLGLAEALARAGSKKTAIGILRQFEADVGKCAESLALPPRILARRIAESARHDIGPLQTPLFGRDKDLERLSAHWSRARAGHFTPLLIVGAESIGKSRLASEFAAIVRMTGGNAIISRRSPLDTQRPLSVFADIAKELLAFRGAAGCWPHTLASLARLTRTQQPDHASESEQSDFEYSNAAIRRAVSDLFDSVLSEQPLVLVLDDAEHVDDASLALLKELRRCLSARPCLLLLLSRTAHLSKSLGAATVRLGPLSDSACREFAAAVVSSANHGPSAEVIDRSVSLAAGNPGHLCLLLLEKAAIRDPYQIPTSLIAAVDARLGTLSSKALHLLQACAILGTSCSSDAARQLTGLRGYSLISSIQELEHAALITCTMGGIHCASTLIEERVRLCTTPAITALLHDRAARLLERGASTTTSQALSWTVAEHWRQAGVPDAALRWKQRCWQQLLSIGHPLSAVTGIRASLAEATSLEERAILLSSLAGALRAIGDFDALREVLQDRIALCDEVNDPVGTRRSLAFDLLEAKEVSQFDLQPSLAALQDYVTDPTLDSTRRLRAARLLLIGTDLFFDAEAASLGFAACRDINAPTSATELLRLQAMLIFHSSFGDRHAAAECAQQLLLRANTVERSWGRLSAMKVYVIAHRIVAVKSNADEVLEGMFRECVDYGVHRTAVGIAGLLSSFLFDDGDVEGARRWGDIAKHHLAQLAPNELATDYSTSQIDLALYDGDYPAAERILHDLAAVAPRAPRPRWVRELLVYKARVDQFAGRGTDEGNLAELVRLHTIAQAFSRHDDHMEVLWVALRERGEATEASRILRHYLASTRKETRRCNYWLRTRTAEDAVWSEPAYEHLA